MSIFSTALLSSISIRPSNGVRFYDGCCLDLAVFLHFQNLLTFFPQFIDERAGGCGTAMFSAFDSGAGGRLDDFVLLVMIR